jgi:uroporphyrinogen-III synthase
VKPTLLITRPAGLGEATAEAAERAGFAALVAPLLVVGPVPFQPPVARPEALVFTSPQAPALARHPDLPRDVPAWTVGARTAAAARAAGFSVAGEGRSDARALLAEMVAAGVQSALHLRGEDVAPLEVPPGLRLDARTVYRARALDRLPPAAETALRAGACDAVLLFSPRTAAIFACLADRAGLARPGIALVAISARAADAAGQGWRAVVQADAPSQGAMLRAACALLRTPLCG